MFTNLQLVDFVLSMLGQPYWYGTCVYPCTESRLKSKAKQYPSHYAAGRMPKYRDAIKKRQVCMDCVGMIKGFFWTDGGKGVLDYINGGAEFKNTYKGNGCPDKSADGMLEYCKQQGAKWGKIDTLPDVPGVLVFLSGHVGVYIGGGYVVEARGFAYGVVKTKLSNRPWKHWAYLPDSLLTYITDAVPAEPVYKLGDRLLKLTSPLTKGDDVKELQSRLNKLGYDCGKADGEFGNNTRKGVIAFQKAAKIGVDGKFGAQSLAALRAAESRTASVDAIAREVIKGKWGVGADRKKRLAAAGYDYDAVQRRVNELIKKG